MGESFESKLRRLEGKKGPTIDDPPEFVLFLVKPKHDGSMLRRTWPDGKYSKVDPKTLGIAPYKPTKHAPKVVEPTVAINVPKVEEYAPAPVNEGLDLEDFERWWNSDGMVER